ncbi:COP9 signalosome [Amylocystis lapponica]|nr:COP9 signalosome [Amylocystis lapponica]
MTGPPTPPLSTPTEIEDAARSSLPPQVAIPSVEAPPPAPQIDHPPRTAQSAAPAVPDNHASYELLFPTIADLAVRGELQELIRVAEHSDLSAEKNNQTTRLLLVAPLVLAYLILDELAAARHALARLPDSLRHHALPQALFNLLASAWERKYDVVYSRAEDLFRHCEQSDFLGADFLRVLAGMVTAFVEAFRKKTFALIAKAYTSIPAPLAQGYLGFTNEQVLAAAEASGWSYDASTQILTPKAASASHLNGTTGASSTLVTFSAVVGGLARLGA